MKVLFLHGRRSVVVGVKPTDLRDAGHELLNPALDDDDFDAAVHTAQAEYDRHRPDIIVRSCSFARLGRTGTPNVKPQTAILHSRQDDVIPFADSEELVTNSGLPPETLVEVGNDHRLADPELLMAMLAACEKLAGGPTDAE